MQAVLRVLRRAGPDRRAAQGARSGTDCRPSAAADRSTQSGTEQGAGQADADLLVVGLLGASLNLPGGKLLAQRLVTLEHVE